MEKITVIPEILVADHFGGHRTMCSPIVITREQFEKLCDPRYLHSRDYILSLYHRKRIAASAGIYSPAAGRRFNVRLCGNPIFFHEVKHN